MKVFDVMNSLILASSGEGVLNPIYAGITLIGPYALSVVAALSIFYGVFLAVRYAKSQSEDERANAQKTLINFLIGVAVVIVLVVVLLAIRGPLGDYINS
ncbi:MAG: hypothetical protein IJX17_07520 [Clostridia bacterium]|nr:hypothetical protein [Clostridia bacterium]